MTCTENSEINVLPFEGVTVWSDDLTSTCNCLEGFSGNDVHKSVWSTTEVLSYSFQYTTEVDQMINGYVLIDPTSK